ncbi:MAG: ABC transporter permease [Hyphomicrobiaceae bacterium]
MSDEVITRTAAFPVRTGANEDVPLEPQGTMSARHMVIARLVIVGALLGAWEFAPVSRGIKFWLSSPSAILSTLWGWMADGSLWAHLGATLSVMVTGYVMGCTAGIGLGFIFGFLPRLYRVLVPFITAFYALPKIALAPLFIILLGIGMSSKVALVAITVFFLLLNSTIDGVNDVDRDLVQSLRLMGATRVEVLRKVLLPSALPWIFTGARISVRYAFTATLLAELIAANRGLGFLIEFNSGNFNATGSYAAIVVLVAFSVTLTEVLTRLQAITATRRN